MEIAVLIMVASEFGRTARSAGKGPDPMRLLGGLGYAFVLILAQIGLSAVSGTLSNNPTFLLTPIFITSNGVAIIAVIMAGKVAFARNPLDLNRFFRVFNKIWLIFGCFLIFAAISIMFSEDVPVTIFHFALVSLVMAPATALYAERGLRRKSSNARTFAGLALIANGITLVALVYQIADMTVSHPIALSIMESYCSAWFSIIAFLNVCVLAKCFMASSKGSEKTVK